MTPEERIQRHVDLLRLSVHVRKGDGVIREKGWWYRVWLGEGKSKVIWKPLGDTLPEAIHNLNKLARKGVEVDRGE